MSRIELHPGVPVFEYRAGLLEADTMLAQIGLGFAGIPFEAHDRSPST